MQKLRVEDLERIKKEVRERLSLKEDGLKGKITVYAATCGLAAGAQDIIDFLKTALAENKRDDIKLTIAGCVGMCSHEPVVEVELLGQEPIFYGPIDKEKMVEIFQSHILGGNVVSKYALARGRWSDTLEAS